MFSPDGRFIASGSNDNFIKIWDIQSGKCVKDLKGPRDEVISLAFSSDGRFIASSSSDGTIRLWDVNTGKETAQIIHFDDGEWVVITSKGYYTCSKNGEEHINFIVDNKFYPSKYFHPILFRGNLNLWEL